MAEERLTKPRSGRTCVRIAFSAGQITIPQSHDRRDRSWAIPDGHQHGWLFARQMRTFHPSRGLWSGGPIGLRDARICR